MTTTDTDTPAAGLRAWASGYLPLEAAVELLIRSDFAQTWRPWIVPCDEDGSTARAHWHAVDFEILMDSIGPMSGGERRLLTLAASIAGRGGEGKAVVIGDMLGSLNRGWVDLILAAIAHAAGTHQGSRLLYNAEGDPTGFEPITTSLHPWPESGDPA